MKSDCYSVTELRLFLINYKAKNGDIAIAVLFENGKNAFHTKVAVFSQRSQRDCFL